MPAGLAYLASNGTWVFARHLRILNDALLDVAARRTRNLIINMPPRHGKSMLVSQNFPPWWIGTFPDETVMVTSYGSDLAASWGGKAREVMSNWGPDLWNIRVRSDISSSSHWRLRGREGGMLTTGVGGPITGRGGSLLIVDDPIKNAEEARSKRIRDLTWEWYTSTAYTRLEPNGCVVVIQTRWHEDDLTGRLLSREYSTPEDWRVISLPAIAEGPGDLLGRAEGEALWPMRYDAEKLSVIRATLGTYWWNSLYQQRPRPEEGAMFKQHWFGRYRSFPETGLIRRVQSWDTAHTRGDGASYSVCTQTAKYDTGYFIENVWRERWEYPELKKTARRLYEENRPDLVLVENKSSGQALVQELKRETGIPILPINVDTDKVARAHACTPECEAGRVFIPERAPWVGEWLQEICFFPNGMYDDQVDSFTQSINYLKGSGNRVTISELRL